MDAANLIPPVDLRSLLAASLAALWLLWCLWLVWRRRQLPAASAALQVVYASQSGQAEAIARQSAAMLAAGGEEVAVLPLEALCPEQLSPAQRLLFVVSTAGEGHAPDHAGAFVRRYLQAPAGQNLRGLRYGLLALGDRKYAQFCGFGRTLDTWLQGAGAQPDFPRIEADRLDAGALQRWRSALGAAAEAPGFDLEAGFGDWHFTARQLLNAGSPGEAMCRIVLQPAAGPLPAWQAGDLVDVLLPGIEGARTYSIASAAASGVLELIVRSARRADGSPGLASRWFNELAAPGAALRLRVRSNPGFHAPDGEVPLLLIGAGSGLAGLRGHIEARRLAVQQAGAAAAPRCTWLLFGERSAQFDRLDPADLAAWQQAGVLSRLTTVFSREGAERRYVQHALREEAAAVRDWVEAGACLLICGSADTMARGVEAALGEVLGAARLAQLQESGRIRRDVF